MATLDETTGGTANDDSPERLAARLRALPNDLPEGRLTLGGLLSRLGEQQAAFILLVFSIPAIVPTPGIPAGMIFGTALALIALQMMFGRGRPVLPARLGAVGLPRGLVERMATGGAHLLERFGGWLKPRAHGFAGSAVTAPVSLVVFLMAVLIALPIPFGNVLPGFSVLLIALGQAERDGVAVALGLAMALVAVLFSIAMIAGGWWLVSSWLWGA